MRTSRAAGGAAVLDRVEGRARGALEQQLAVQGVAVQLPAAEAVYGEPPREAAVAASAG
jgi:hypothetical protein